MPPLPWPLPEPPFPPPLPFPFPLPGPTPPLPPPCVDGGGSVGGGFWVGGGVVCVVVGGIVCTVVGGVVGMVVVGVVVVVVGVFCWLQSEFDWSLRFFTPLCSESRTSLSTFDGNAATLSFSFATAARSVSQRCSGLSEAVCALRSSLVSSFASLFERPGGVSPQPASGSAASATVAASAVSERVSLIGRGRAGRTALSGGRPSESRARRRRSGTRRGARWRARSRGRAGATRRAGRRRAVGRRRRG